MYDNHDKPGSQPQSNPQPKSAPQANTDPQPKSDPQQNPGVSAGAVGEPTDSDTETNDDADDSTSTPSSGKPGAAKDDAKPTLHAAKGNDDVMSQTPQKTT